MAKVGAQRAAELTGKSKSTIQRAMNSGKLSYEMDANNRRIIDVSELERVFGLASPSTQSASSAPSSVEAELKKAADMLEMERMKMKIKMLEENLENANSNLEDMKSQRDQWQKQAQQVLITSQYSQKQAEEYKTELKTREEKARKRREQMMAERMQKMQGENQNKQDSTQGNQARKLTEENAHKESTESQEQSARAFDFQNLWQKIRGGKAA